MLRVELILQVIEEPGVRRRIKVAILVKTGVESILRDADMLAHDAREEGHLRQVSLHLSDEVLAKYSQVLNARASRIDKRIGAKGSKNLLILLHLLHVVVISLWVSSQLVADAVQMHKDRLHGCHQLLVFLLFPAHEPGTFFGCRCI